MCWILIFEMKKFNLARLFYGPMHVPNHLVVDLRQYGLFA